MERLSWFVFAIVMLHKLKLEVIGLWRYYGGILQRGHRVLQRAALQLQWWWGMLGN
jgi:hypothetical protein